MSSNAKAIAVALFDGWHDDLVHLEGMDLIYVRRILEHPTNIRNFGVLKRKQLNKN